MNTPTSSSFVGPGTVLGGFKLVSRVGSGGMGEVWRAQNVRVDRMVRAIKVIRPELASNPDFRQRFLNEAEFLEILQHPNILRVENISEEGGVLFMVMELLQGLTVDAYQRMNGMRLAPPVAARILHQALQGVAHAHKAGVLHRDLKPANLFLTESGVTRILDFGIARHGDGTGGVTRTGQGIPGSPAYFAPEFVEGAAASPQSDVYALGITLYELLAGELPFKGGGSTDAQSAIMMMTQHATRPLPDIRALVPDLPADLVALLSATTSKKPAERPTADGFAANLAALAGQASLAFQAPPGAFSGATATPARVATPGSPLVNPGTPSPRTPVSSPGTPATMFALPSSDGLAVRATPAPGAGTMFEVPSSDRISPVPRAAAPSPSEKSSHRPAVIAVGVTVVLMGLGLVGLDAMKGRKAHGKEHGAVETAAGPSGPAATTPPAPAAVPDGMVLLNGGTFRMGRAAYGVDGALDVPEHDVTVGRFYLDRTEVTAAAYKVFVDTGAARAPWPAALKDLSRLAPLPVVNVTIDDAERYCRFKRGARGRLPTEAEWEFAARGGTARLYPFGDAMKRDCINGFRGEKGVLMPVGSTPCGDTPEGLQDMAGNAWEWTSGAAALYPGAAGKPPPDGLHVVRGGSFFNAADEDFTVTRRQFAMVPNRFVGFRCAAEP